ncbi:TRAM domain-containing protein [Candidatus Hecatella orcuttiae]|jgi:predicted RNA-binding protein with TRAM domain|uniref:TRAM domain-containing protein n=1 Tax=Candidatus Hecatella orcuttiae TaxID=1935119 RepID=UPI002868251F|nr:TRAM domain-containing protein [Candidatus Hecatella orcuttiae]
MSYQRDFGSRSFRKPAPVEAGKEYEVTITETSRRGDGVARIQGFIIFVASAKRGEQVKIRITDVKSRFAQAVIA